MKKHKKINLYEYELADMTDKQTGEYWDAYKKSKYYQTSRCVTLSKAILSTALA